MADDDWNGEQDTDSPLAKWQEMQEWLKSLNASAKSAKVKSTNNSANNNSNSVMGRTQPN